MRFVLIAYLLLALPTFAHWGEKGLRIIEDVGPHHPMADPYKATVYGVVGKSDYAYPPHRLLEPLSRRRYHFKYSRSVFSGGDFQVIVRYLKNKSPCCRKRPVFVLNPGVFKGLNPLHGEKLVRRMLSLGYVVISFANPLSTDFIDFGPQFEIADFERIASIQNFAAQNIIRTFERQGLVERPYILGGISLGGFLSSIQYSQEKYKNLFDEMVLFSPPVNFFESIGRLDRLQKISDSLPVKFRPLGLIAGALNIRNSQSGGGELRNKSIDIIARFGFGRNLKKSAGRIQKGLGEKIIKRALKRV